MKLAALAAVLVMPSLANAGTITAGVSLGMTQSRADANAGDGSNETLGIFGRLNLTSRVAGQLELLRTDSNAEGTTMRSGTALIVVDLGSGSRLMPIMLAGIGFDSADDPNSFSSTSGYHIEGGFGLEYRADGGLTFGADLRMGGRSINNPEIDFGGAPPPSLANGDYRSARAYAAVRF